MACAHLGSAAGLAEKMQTVTERLGLVENADLQTLYDALLPAMTDSYAALAKILEGKESGAAEPQSG